jgi:hypothetical protein
VAGAARDARRKAPRLGLLVLATACAAAQEPPGGPPDLAPPVLLAVQPDTDAVLPGFKDPVVFTFDDVISEASGGKLVNLFLISPRPERVDVSWKRHRITVRPKGGWRPNTIYHVTMLPGISDLRNNQLKTGSQLVFSTGLPIPDTRVTGTVVDWQDGRIGAGALVEAITPDSLDYFTVADSAGDFTLDQLPAGRYALIATIDANNNRRRDRREPFDSLPLQLDSTASFELWAYAHDTTGPRLTQLARVDSTTVRLEFSQKLLPGEPPADSVTVRQLPDSTPIAVLAAWTVATYDSVRQAEAPADTARQDTTAAARDTAGQARDTTAFHRDTTRAQRPRAAPPRRTPTRDTTAAAAGPGLSKVSIQPAQPDTGRIATLLRQRPVLHDAWIIRLARPLAPGAHYVIEARAANVSGAVATSHTVLMVPDSTTERRP